VSAILITDASFPAFATVPVAAVVCFGAGFLIGLPALRLRGLYLAILTLGLAVATPQLIKRFDGLTGGTQGLNVEQPAAPAWTGLADDQFLYLATLAFTVVMFLLAARLVRGRVGRALIAIRDNETAAKAQGVNPARYKTLAFATGSLYAGVGGALYVFSIGFVAPESFTLVVSFSFLAAIVVGGLATIGGALFGALFIEFVPVYAGDVDEALAGVIYGAVLIAFMYALPGGVMGALRKLRDKFNERGSKDAEDSRAVDGVAGVGGEPGSGMRAG
jgi:branched-chain amino acid transport system permease protein